MKARRAAALARWWRIVRLRLGWKPPPRQLLRSPDQARQRQAVAARRAFLSQLSPGQRVLAGPDFGDTH